MTGLLVDLRYLSGRLFADAETERALQSDY